MPRRHSWRKKRAGRNRFHPFAAARTRQRRRTFCFAPNPELRSFSSDKRDERPGARGLESGGPESKRRLQRGIWTDRLPLCALRSEHSPHRGGAAVPRTRPVAAVRLAVAAGAPAHADDVLVCRHDRIRRRAPGAARACSRAAPPSSCRARWRSPISSATSSAASSRSSTAATGRFCFALVSLSRLRRGGSVEPGCDVAEAAVAPRRELAEPANAKGSPGRDSDRPDFPARDLG